MYNYHKLGMHIQGFLLVWEKLGKSSGNRRYLVDMFNSQLFPFDVDFKKCWNRESVLEQGNACGMRPFYEWDLEKLTAYFLICAGSKIVKKNRNHDLERPQFLVQDPVNTATISKEANQDPASFERFQKGEVV
ncbi:unnamed protein product [Caenorhabditis nigoni]|uniref:Uncharacterized protein n=1 Tax=Caenorhabditis nigoni TaxID=1611254 RepID=A0A2G5TCM7_9PELO|nr:hypothetical protein B9Z55_018121 [Caenorhabditis nigoni]